MRITVSIPALDISVNSRPVELCLASIQCSWMIYIYIYIYIAKIDPVINFKMEFCINYCRSGFECVA